jgi:AraC-like DNA-binding protein
MELKNNRRASDLDVNNILKYLPNFFIAKLLEVIITFTHCPDKNIDKTSNLLKQFINHIPNNTPAFDIHALEETICTTIDNKTEINLDNVLCWYELLYNKFKDEMFSDINKFIRSYIKLLPETNENKITLMITFLCSLVKYNEKNIEPIITILTEQFHKNSKLVTSSYASKIIKNLCENLGVVKVFRQFAETLLKIKDISFLQNFLKKLDGYLHEEKVLKEVKEYFLQLQSNDDVKEFFTKMFSVLCYTPISALMFCIIAGYFELSFNVLLNFGNVTLGVDYVAQFQIIINYIENHYADNLSLSALATRFSLSQSYIARIFRKELYCKPSEYVNKIRISVAKTLLAQTNLSVSEIAEKVGFLDVYYFSKVFKKIIGTSPIKYRL